VERERHARPGTRPRDTPSPRTTFPCPVTCHPHTALLNRVHPSPTTEANCPHQDSQSTAPATAVHSALCTVHRAPRSPSPPVSVASTVDPHPRATRAVNGRHNGKRYPAKEKRREEKTSALPPDPSSILQITPARPPPSSPPPEIQIPSQPPPRAPRARAGLRALGFRAPRPLPGPPASRG
jgi:hypothetical protein